MNGLIFVNWLLFFSIVMLFVALKKIKKAVSAYESENASIEQQMLDESEEEALQRISTEDGGFSKKVEDGTLLLNRLVELKKETDEKIKAVDIGLIPPTFAFDDDEKLKNEIIEIQRKQKNYILSGLAVRCVGSWDIDGRIIGVRVQFL